jgi:hypothetical protein
VQGGDADTRGGVFVFASQDGERTKLVVWLLAGCYDGSGSPLSLDGAVRDAIDSE